MKGYTPDPKAQAQRAKDATELLDQLKIGHKVRKRVMVIDTDAVVLHGLHALLEEDGFDVQGFEDVEKALVYEETVRMVFLGTRPRGKSLAEAMELLRSKPATRDARYIALSGQTRFADLNEILDQHFDGLLLKPIKDGFVHHYAQRFGF
jgi:CheY-like chemotaxis protein